MKKNQTNRSTWEVTRPTKKEKMKATTLQVEDSTKVDNAWKEIEIEENLNRWKIDSFSGRGRLIEKEEYKEWKKLKKQQGKVREEMEKHKRWLSGDEAFRRGNFDYSDLSNMQLSNYTLSGASFERTNFSNSIFCDVSFAGANLSVAICENTIFSKCDFSGTNLRGAIFNGTVFLEDNFSRADFTTAYFHKPVMYNLIFHKSDFSHASFNKVLLSMTDLTEEILDYFKCDKEKIIYKVDIEESKMIKKLLKRSLPLQRKKIGVYDQAKEFMKKREEFMLKMEKKSLPTYSEQEIKEKITSSSSEKEKTHRRTYSY